MSRQEQWQALNEEYDRLNLRQATLSAEVIRYFAAIARRESNTNPPEDLLTQLEEARAALQAHWQKMSTWVHANT